jgi:glutathione synthase/RimK-type ligase-like ATP-grasp enzyme
MQQEEPVKKILIIEENRYSNWYEIFDGVGPVEIDGVKYKLKIEQARFEDLSLASYTDNGGEAIVDISAHPDPFPGTPQSKGRTFKPDFVMIRNTIRSTSSRNFVNIFFGLVYAGVPMINSPQAIYANLERSIMFGGLLSIQKRLGRDQFPLIYQCYYSSARAMNITPSYPIVVKVAHVHSSLGKVRLEKHSDFEDLASVIAIHNDYCTAEPYIEGEYDLRIQKIGDHIRVMKRTGTGQWKTNNGLATLEDHTLNETYKLWLDEASSLFGGMDICALDVIHSTDGKEYILELNDSSIGLGPEHVQEDNLKIRQLLLRRLVEHYSKDGKQVEVEKPFSNEVWKIEKLNLENENGSLKKQFNDLKVEFDGLETDIQQLRTQLRQVRREKASQGNRGLLFNVAVGILVGCLTSYFFTSYL